MDARGPGQGYKTTGLGRDINTCGGKKCDVFNASSGGTHNYYSTVPTAIQNHSVLVTNTIRLRLRYRA